MASLQGCQSGSTLSVDSLAPKPAVHVDPSVTQECQGVVDIPHRFISIEDETKLHAEDRRRLGDCVRLNHAKGDTIKALVQ